MSTGLGVFSQLILQLSKVVKIALHTSRCLTWMSISEKSPISGENASTRRYIWCREVILPSGARIWVI